MKAKAHKLFGGKKGDQVHQNQELQNDHHEGDDDVQHGNEKQNGVGTAVFFQNGVGTQQATSNRDDYEDDGDIGDDENEEVRL